MSDALVLPPLPTYKGRWCPVYWTPIVGASEQLTAFIASRGEDGQTCLRQTIRDEILVAVFGEQRANGLRSMLSFVEDSLACWLSTDQSLGEESAWLPPLSGFRAGAWRESCAENVRQLAAQGICSEAAFANSAFADLNQD